MFISDNHTNDLDDDLGEPQTKGISLVVGPCTKRGRGLGCVTKEKKDFLKKCSKNPFPAILRRKKRRKKVSTASKPRGGG